MVLTKEQKNKAYLSGRLYYLFLANGYDIEKNCHAIKDLAKDLEYNNLVTNYSNAAAAIRKHITGKNKNLESEWIEIYCRYFNCSADYILGFIQEPTHELTEVNEKTGLSSAAISKLLRADSDKKIIYDRLVAGGYLDKLVSVVNAFYDIGSSVQINGEKVTDKETIRNLEKAIDNIKLKMLRDNGADCIHELTYDKQVQKHFKVSRINLYKSKSKKILGDSYDSSVLDNWIKEIEKED